MRKHYPPAAGCEVVFHCATAAPAAANTANKKLMHDVNVKGTQNIIEACASQVTISGFKCILILHHNQPVPLKHEQFLRHCSMLSKQTACVPSQVSSFVILAC